MGYVNRVVWMVRNKLYGLKRKLSYGYTARTVISLKGTPDISDKYKVPGYLHVSAREKGKLRAFEFYGVFPYRKERDVYV